MKKTAIILGAVLFLFTASVNAQNDTLPKQPTTTQTDPALTSPERDVATTTTATNSTDRWNNWSPDKYKMLPMPEPLTTEKIFPVIGQYSVTSKDAAAAPTTDVNASPESAPTTNLTITLDETNKGVVWIDGLPQGRIKAYLRKSPSTYMIPAQKTADEKEISQGVMIYDKDMNTLDVCIGCKYNSEDPATAFLAPQEPVAEEPVVKTKSKTKKGTAKAKVKPVKTWRYSGSKNVETTASSSVVPMQQ
jgi:hypothetical protein